MIIISVAVALAALFSLTDSLLTITRHELSGIASQFAMQNLRFAM